MGFGLVESSGRCYCNHVEFSTCQKQYFDYKSYTWQGMGPSSQGSNSRGSDARNSEDQHRNNEDQRKNDEADRNSRYYNQNRGDINRGGNSRGAMELEYTLRWAGSCPTQPYLLIKVPLYVLNSSSTQWNW